MIKRRSNSRAKPKPSRPHAPGYGFPKGQKGLLPWAWAEQRLKKSHNYWITTVRPDGSPHTMVVWGLWQDGRFLFSTGSKSRKARNLAGNSNCIVSTEHANEAVIVEGEAEIADVAARREMLPAYEKKYKFDMSSMKDDILAMKEPVFAVRRWLCLGCRRNSFRASPRAGNSRFSIEKQGVGALIPRLLRFDYCCYLRYPPGYTSLRFLNL